MSSPPHRAAAARPGRPPAWLVAAGLALAGCSGPPPATFDLTQHEVTVKAIHARRQLSVMEPTALQPLDSDKVLVRRPDGSLAMLAKTQWSDHLTRVVQSRIVQAFEKAGALGHVSAFGGVVTPDLTLQVEIQVFEVDVGSSQGNVEIAASLVGATSGRTLAAHVFKAHVPGGTEGPAAVDALDQALGQVLGDLVRWAAPYL